MTTKKTLNPEVCAQLDSRYAALRYNLDFIANHLDRTSALYPMMARVIYEDFETLVATTIEDHTAINDN